MEINVKIAFKVPENSDIDVEDFATQFEGLVRGLVEGELELVHYDTDIG